MRRNKIFQLAICLLIIISMILPTTVMAASTTTSKPVWCWEGGSKHVTPDGIGWYSSYNEAKKAGLAYIGNSGSSGSWEVQECDCGKFTVYVTIDELPTTHTHTWNTGVVTKQPTCTLTGVKTYTCTGCSETKTETISALGHSYVQTITSPTCIENGYTTYVCSRCKDTYRNDFVPAKGHNYIYIPNNDKTHIVACSNCDIEETQDCSLQELNDEFICSLCNASYEKEKPTEKEEPTTSDNADPEEPKPHTHTWNDGIINKDATCVEKGEIIYTCIKCGETKTEIIPTIKHNYNKTVVNPTCTSGGYTKYICNYCGDEIQTNQTEAIEHSYKNEVIKPTCTVKGYTLHTCTMCNYSYQDNFTNVIAHNYDNGKVTKKATCTATGIKSYSCINCKATKTETIKKTSHTYKKTITKATINKDGKITESCTQCKAVKSTSTIPKIKSLTLSTTATYYTGKVKTPSVTVKDSKGKTLKKGTDYDVVYGSGRKNVGRYAVTVKFKGNYSGSKTLYFNIIPRGISKISKVTAKSKGFTVQWTKQRTQTTGYQIQYSTSSNFKNAKTITMPKNTYYAKNIKGLKGNKKYYVRIRTYKVVKFNGKNYNIYSPYCASKAITTKR